jgi:hypothetical protein
MTTGLSSVTRGFVFKNQQEQRHKPTVSSSHVAGGADRSTAAIKAPGLRIKDGLPQVAATWNHGWDLSTLGLSRVCGEQPNAAPAKGNFVTTSGDFK